MKIGSNPPHSQPPPDGNTGRNRATRPSPNEQPGDVLQLSESVRSWLGSSEDPQLCLSEQPEGIYDEAKIRSRQLAADLGPTRKLDQIRSRIGAGYYDQSWVKEITADRLADEIQESPDSADSL